MFDQFVKRGALVYNAPGRVNLIGEHTDYNDGFVLPVAINFYTRVAVSPRNDRTLSVFSESFSEQIEFDLDELNPKARGHWSDYIRGVSIILRKAGHRLKGADLAVFSDVPIGAGLSSSAALEVAAAYTLLVNSGINCGPMEIAKLCQRAENEFAGMRCGIMDQWTACFGQSDHALMLDCRSLEHRVLPLPRDIRLVVCNTMVKHSLASSEYNKRRAECESASRYFASKFGSSIEARSLRDVGQSELEHARGELDGILFRRARHVINENARVIQAAQALEQGDLHRFGDLMDESHASLRDDYEVSCEELDLMVELARREEGVYGSRMTGGGFGGCTINLVHSDAVVRVTTSIAESYANATGLRPEIYVCTASDGAKQTNSVINGAT